MPHVDYISLSSSFNKSIGAPEADFLINNKDLSKQIYTESNISPLSGKPDFQKDVISWFLLEESCAELGGRVPVAVCHYCGGFECGCFTIRISQEDDLMIWHHLRYTSLDEYQEFEDSGEEYTVFKFFKRKFKIDQYREVFQLYRNQLNGS